MSEEWCYCVYKELNLARSYQKIRQRSNYDTLCIDLMEVWSAGECLLSIVFNHGVAVFFVTNADRAHGRITPVDIFQGSAGYEPWPLFEIKNSERLRLFGFNNDSVLQGLRHFFVLTDSEFIDVFSYHPPRMIVKNRFDCDGKEHRDGFCKPEQDNIQIVVP